MADLAVRYDATARRLDLVPAAADADDNGLVARGDLETAILASLLTWARAPSDAALPDFSDDRKGYWGDSYPRREGRRVGCLWWLRMREVVTAELIAQVRQDAEEALRWLIEDGVVDRFDITVTRPEPNRLDVLVEAVQPDRRVLRLRFADLWHEIGKVV